MPGRPKLFVNNKKCQGHLKEKSTDTQKENEKNNRLSLYTVMNREE